eukprot:TRINITY_DN16461_c0_g1_i1.p1 TRINITY_DN16461_c0_g1~~TRINITY_DN16461_c0_g1_i1.p1  ORF type:complete len:787 (-),score=133.55 TRINITY_DN16461_c0_g1_i1:370-2679(-)
MVAATKTVSSVVEPSMTLKQALFQEKSTSSQGSSQCGESVYGMASIESDDWRRQRSAPAGLIPTTAQGHKAFGHGNEQYTMEEVLGEGNYGSVYRCRRSRDNTDFAVKVIDTMRIGFVGGETGMKAAELMAVREVDALRQLSSHPTVISLEAAFINKTTRQIFIVTDLIRGGHLFSHIVQRHTPLKETEASHIVAQLTDGLCFAHALGVVHRDLKLENVLVDSVDIHLLEKRDPNTGAVEWQTVELFSVKICDFGFAKSLQAYTTMTPVGTGNYAAPEINISHIDRQVTGCEDELTNYDAFKADPYSLGVMVFVLLCLAFPAKDKSKHSHRSHKLWPTLSVDAQSFVDGLLEDEPTDRLTIIEAHNHQWVKLVDQDEHDMKRRMSRERIVLQAEAEHVPSSKLRPTSSQAVPTQKPKGQDNALAGVLALHRALVHVQQERGMACWALASDTGIGGISCLDQLQWHVQLTEKRIWEAKALMKDDGTNAIDALFHLIEARKLAMDAVRSGEKDAVSLLACFDRVFCLYNQASSALIELIASSIVAVRGENNAAGRRGARRYRLYACAAEQLGRERAFVCAHGQGRLGFGILKASEVGLPAVAEAEESAQSPQVANLSPERLCQLAEIIGARKILLGTVVDATADTLATSEGLLATLIWEDEGSLLSPTDIANLESLERRVLSPTFDDPAPTEEWYQTITSFLNEIHSRIAVLIVDEVHVPEELRDMQAGELRRDSTIVVKKASCQSLRTSRGGCCCQAGLKRFLRAVADKL